MIEYDVFSFGVLATSTLYLLADPFPARGGYAEIVEKHRHIGGEAANSSLVLARLGLRVKLDGNWVNPDADADFLRAVFTQNGVDISRISFRTCRGPKEMLLVDPDTRTIFGTYGRLQEEKSWNMPTRADIENGRVVCLDPFFGAASRQVAAYANALQRPIVTVDCPYDDPIFANAAIAIISEAYIGHAYPDEPVAAITERYRARSNGTVIFTFGHKEILYGSKDDAYRGVAPYPITPVDTTGAGDSFRAGIIYGMLKGWATEESIRFASALAAVVCQSFPGVLQSPRYEEVVSFMEASGHAE